MIDIYENRIFYSDLPHDESPFTICSILESARILCKPHLKTQPRSQVKACDQLGKHTTTKSDDFVQLLQIQKDFPLISMTFKKKNILLAVVNFPWILDWLQWVLK